MNYGRAKEYGPQGCQVAVENGKCGETKTLGILNEFKTLYETRMDQLDAEINAGGDCLQEKLNLQGQWIRDLMDQNEMMARTVEQLEIEASERVQMLEEKLQSSAKCICEVMKRYREYSSSLHLDEPFQKMFYVENDLKNLLEFIRRIREDNRWSIEGLQFYDVTYKDLFGNKGCTRNDCPIIGTNNAEHTAKQEEIIEDKERKIDTLSKDADRISQYGDPEKLSEALKKKDTEFKDLKQSMLDMRKALTEEVASKHDAICALKRDVQQLEEQCVQADKQIAFKEDIIKELRKELKQLKQQAYEESVNKIISLEHETRKSKCELTKLQRELNNMKNELKSSLEESKVLLGNTMESLNASTNTSHSPERLSSIQKTATPYNSDITHAETTKDSSSLLKKINKSGFSPGLVKELISNNESFDNTVLFNWMAKELTLLKEHIAVKDKVLLDQVKLITVLTTNLYEINKNLEILEANVAKCNKEVLEEDNAAVKQSLNSFKKENDALKDKIANEKRQIADLEKQFKEFLAEKEELKKKLKDAKTNAENATENLSKNETVCKKYAKEMNKLKDEVERLESELLLIKKDKRDLQSQINDLEYDNSKLKKDKLKMEDEAKSTIESTSTTTSKVEDLEKKIKTLETDLKEALESKDKFLNQSAILKVNIAYLTNKLLECQKERPSKKKTMCVCKILPNKCLEISEKCEIHKQDTAKIPITSSPKPISTSVSNEKITVSPKPLKSLAKSASASNNVMYGPRNDPALKDPTDDDSLNLFDRAYREDITKCAFPDLSIDEIQTKDDIIKIQSDTLNLLQLELQDTKTKSLQVEKETEERKAEVEDLSNKVGTLEARLIDCQGRADNLQTAVDFYINSINVLEAAEERARIEIEQQKLTIVNLQDALVATKHELDELKQSQKQEVSLGWAARWLGTGVSKPSNNNNSSANQNKPVHDI